VGKYFPPFSGGMENFLADLISAQKQQGNEVSAVVHDHSSDFSQFFSKISTESIEQYTIYRVPTYGRLLYAPISPHFPFWLNFAIAEFQPDVLHLHLPNTSAFWALILPSARKIPWIIHWHADVISAVDKRISFAYPFYKPFEQALLKRAIAIIATSPPYLESSIPLKNWQKKCHVLPLGMDLKRLPEPTESAKNWAKQQWQFANQPSLSAPLKLLTVGRLTYYKGHETLIRALAQVTDIQAIIVGKGEKQQELLSLIARLNLTHRITLLGHCSNEELMALFSQCDCFCLPSWERTEAFGVVLMEAMRYAKPVIATAISGSGVNWVVREGKTGLLVPPKNFLALAQALNDMKDNADIRIAMGQAGYCRFIETFNIQEIAKQLSTIYSNYL
jgi:glycosyltransferase involved in cell wall biosynthesis